MNKTQLILISGIIVVGGLIGYTFFGKQEVPHTSGDGHMEVEHTQNAGTVAPHDDAGTEPHID